MRFSSIIHCNFCHSVGFLSISFHHFSIWITGFCLSALGNSVHLCTGQSKRMGKCCGVLCVTAAVLLDAPRLGGLIKVRFPRGKDKQRAKVFWTRPHATHRAYRIGHLPLFFSSSSSSRRKPPALCTRRLAKPDGPVAAIRA